jgi:Ca2+-binding RTX toxin-like protein
MPKSFKTRPSENRNDTVYEGSGRDLLTGGDGNDLVASNEGNDLLSGTDAISRGINEVDTLQSGSGADRFVLAGGMPYYVGGDNADYVSIQDYSVSSDRLLFGTLGASAFTIERVSSISFDILFQDDLIAKVTESRI